MIKKKRNLLTFAAQQATPHEPPSDFCPLPSAHWRFTFEVRAQNQEIAQKYLDFRRHFFYLYTGLKQSDLTC